MKIGIAGAKGSFSEEASGVYATRFGIANPQLEYLISVESVLGNLTEEKIDLGIFPIENSNGGIVIEAVHAMAKYSFKIERLFEIEVNHCLLVKSGKHAHDVTLITSHDQAIKQCRMYLKRAWGTVKLVEYADTAKAAKDLSEGTLSDTTAVIAPKKAAELYGLDVLEENIQDLKFNYTTFIAAIK